MTPAGRPVRDCVGAIVVNYEAGHALLDCVRSLRAEGIDDIIVVDNNSHDGSVAALAVDDPGVRIVVNDRNLGFGTAVNRGLDSVVLDYLLVCNPDLVVHAGAVSALHSRLESDCHFGLVGPALLDISGTAVLSARAFPTVASSMSQAFTGLLFPRGRRSVSYHEANRGRARSDRADWVSGACFLIRVDVLRALGGFDERYYMYLEDVDLCWRLREAGFLVSYEPAAKATHLGGLSAARRSYRMIVAHHRSLWRFARKTTTGGWRLTLPFVSVALIVRLALALGVNVTRRGDALPGASTPSA